MSNNGPKLRIMGEFGDIIFSYCKYCCSILNYMCSILLMMLTRGQARISKLKYSIGPSIKVNIGSYNSLLPDGTVSLHEPMLTYNGVVQWHHISCMLSVVAY